MFVSNERHRTSFLCIDAIDPRLDNPNTDLEKPEGEKWPYVIPLSFFQDSPHYGWEKQDIGARQDED
jgi:hypothetical protein